MGPDSVADRSNIQEGDIVTAIGGLAVTTPKQFYDTLKTVDVKKGVKIELVNSAGRTFEVLKDGDNWRRFGLSPGPAVETG